MKQCCHNFFRKNRTILADFPKTRTFSRTPICSKPAHSRHIQKMPWAIFLFHFYTTIFEKISCHQNFFENFRIFSRKSQFLLNKCWQVANRPQNCQPATPATAKFCWPHKPQNRPRWPNSATSGHTARLSGSQLLIHASTK